MNTHTLYRYLPTYGPSYEKGHNVLSRCHTKRRTGALALLLVWHRLFMTTNQDIITLLQDPIDVLDLSPQSQYGIVTGILTMYHLQCFQYSFWDIHRMAIHNAPLPEGRKNISSLLHVLTLMQSWNDYNHVHEQNVCIVILGTTFSLLWLNELIFPHNGMGYWTK